MQQCKLADTEKTKKKSNNQNKMSEGGQNRVKMKRNIVLHTS